MVCDVERMTPQVLRVWARILRAVPGSRLLLKNKPFACASARAHTSAALAAHGVEPGRVRCRHCCLLTLNAADPRSHPLAKPIHVAVNQHEGTVTVQLGHQSLC